MDIYLIRHTTPEVGKGVCYGQTDLPLADSFSSELMSLRSKLPESFDRIYASPLKRCLQLAQALGSTVQTDDRLMEMDFGDWEMKPWGQIPSDALNPWMADFVETAVPGGESFRELIRRSRGSLKAIESGTEEKVAVVTHAGVIRSWLSTFLELDPKHVFKLNVDYGGVTCVSVNRGLYSVKYVNR